MDIASLKRRQNAEKMKIKRNVIRFLTEKGKAEKKELFSGVMEMSSLTAEERADNSVGSVAVFYRGLIGSVVNDLIENFDISYKSGCYSINREIPAVLIESEIKEYVKNLLRSGKTLTKQEIFEEAVGFFGTDKTKTQKDDNQLRSYIGDFLSKMKNAGLITLEAGVYAFVPEKEPILDSFEEYIKSITANGGEFFERYAAMLLKKYFELSKIKVISCEVTGGSDDGGIDIEIRTEDLLGFRDFITVQAKARRHAQVTLKEVREFIGAMHTKNGTRGIYITTSNFHSEASKLIEQVANVTGIDGIKLYELAKQCRMLK